MPGEERAGRVEDALAGIALSDCLEVISGQRGDRGAGLPELQVLAAAWDHARMVALRMRQAAELEDFPHPEQAYLVGLLHELGRLPAMLGWIAAAPSPTCLHAARGPRRRGERQDAAPGSQPGSLLAEEWRLPSFLVSALRDIEEASTRSPWARLVAAAHHPEKQQGAQAAGMSKRAPLSQASPQRSRVLSFTSHERVAWKHGATVRAHVPAPMRPPA
jgi:HD-like signal output (HDOD) protein